MEFIEVLFMLHFLVALGVTLINLWNVLHKGEKLSLSMCFTVFIIFGFAWFGGLVGLTSETIGATVYNNLNAYAMLFKLTTGFFVLNALFLIIELLLSLNIIANKEVKAYNSFKAYGMTKR